MNSLDDSPEDPGSRGRLPFVLAALAALVAVAAAAWVLLRAPASQPTPVRTPAAAAPAPVPAPPAQVTASPEPAAAVPGTPPRRTGRRAKAPAAQPAATASALLLKVESDVPGASVFVDRVYIGTAPVTTGEVAPGSHVLTVSAEGYESQASTIEVTGGANDVMVRFKVVRLNETVAVVHKHAIGSCEGRLRADARGLRYETANAGHAFAVTFAELKAFEVDYLKKNLRVTRKDGRTFNFTDRNQNADALFVFHKKVEAARAKLAAGLPPADK